MTADKIPGPPKGKPWVWQTADAIKARQSLGINAMRLLDFLMIENMAHAGRRNGFLLAPYDQLVAFGIGRRLIDGAIKEARASGLLAAKRGTGRKLSTYTLTWLPVAGIDFTRRPNGEGAGVVHEGEPEEFTKVNHKAHSGSRRCTTTPRIKGSRRCTPFKKVLTNGSDNTVVSGDDGPVEPAPLDAEALP